MLGIYSRISRLKDEGKDRSIDNQQMLGVAKAKELKLEYNIYTDEGLSGTLDEISQRPSFERLLGDITNGKITAVYAYDQSRFERNPKVRFVINDIFKKFNIRYFTEVDGEVNLHDPQAEFFGDITSVVNKYHVTMTKLKVKAVLKQRAMEGKAHGITPYGYTRSSDGLLVIDPEEAKIIKKIFSMSLSGTGTRSIANTLNDENVLTRYNKISKGVIKVKNKYLGTVQEIPKRDIKWSGNTVRNIIINKIYMGKRTYSGQEFDVPAILKGAYHKKVTDNLAKNRNNSGKKVVHRYMLKGLLRCAKCGRNMYGRTRVNKKDNYYMCSSKRIPNGSCENRSINIDKLEDFIWFHLFSKEGFTKQLKNDHQKGVSPIENIKVQIKAAKQTIQRLNKENDKAILLATKDIISISELSKLKLNIDKQKKTETNLLQTLEDSLDKIEMGTKVVRKYEGEFENFTSITSFSQKTKIVNEFIRNIVVDCFEERIYTVEIEFTIDIPTEKWQTLNLLDANFVRPYLDKNGKRFVMLSIPPPIDDPTNQERTAKYVKKMESQK